MENASFKSKLEPCPAPHKNHMGVRSVPSVAMNKHASANSVFLGEVDEDVALLGYYAASNDNFLPTFRDNISAPPSGVKMIVPKSL